MPIVVLYDNDQKTVIRYEFVGNWTWRDYGQAITEGHRLLEPLPHVADLILDFSRSYSVPSYAMSNLATSLGTLSQRFRMTLIVSNSLYIETLIKVLQRISGDQESMMLVKTLGEARKILANSDDPCA